MFCANLGAALGSGTVELLLHADGSNGSTTFTDHSATPKTITANGGAQISTASPKFGSGSGVFNGSTDYLSTPNDSAWVFGSSPFTVEAWIKTSTLPSGGDFGAVVARGAGGVGGYSWSLSVADVAGAAKLQFLVSSNFDASLSTIINSTSAVATGAWVHVAGVRDGNTLRLFVNGTQEATGTFTGAVFDSSTPLGVGAAYYSTAAVWANYFTGNIDEVRVTKGLAQYRANFTPQAAAFFPP